jgi:hypothetical protein
MDATRMVRDFKVLRRMRETCSPPIEDGSHRGRGLTDAMDEPSPAASVVSRTARASLR